ncbi:MAG TPA: allantoate amidohydrolase [Candidatus Acidoferrales bacterium]|nr:allantoate amidohydrolase [Candidatus Acidoferrales bacterium]
MPITEKDRARTKTVIDRCRKLAGFSERADATCRTFLSPPMRDCHQEITEWLEPLGVDVKIDAAGNLRAFYPAAQPEAPRLLVGSHLDTVPDAGAFDGTLGVVLGVALLESLEGRRLPFGIEIVGFSEEEGVRFGTPFIGSRALVGRVDEELLRREDAHGISVRAAIEDFGLKPAKISGARLKGEIVGYVEFHIEQGPVLDELGLPLGAVEAVAGQSKVEFTFVGRANHAGTTPMHLRRDSVAGAAEWISEVEREANTVPGLVATVGTVEPTPGVTNVIAKETRLTVDVRHRADDVRNEAIDRLIRAAEQTAARRGLSVIQRTLLSQPSVPMDAVLVEKIEQAIWQAGCEPHRMVSGAGHDAMILAERVPAAMVFLRTPGGVSHSPEERVEIDDVAKALETGSHLLELLAGSPARPGRGKRA